MGLFIPEKLILNFLKLQSPLKPLCIESGFVEIDETSDQECIVIYESGDGFVKLSDGSGFLESDSHIILM